MVSKLVGKRVSEESAKDLAKSLDLTGDELGDPPEADLGAIFQKWVSKDPNASTPERLVEALVCTKGLGKFVSGLASKLYIIIIIIIISLSWMSKMEYWDNTTLISVVPSNPADVQSFFHYLGEKWWTMASFLGYTKNDLEVTVTETDSTYQQQITLFLAMFKMPECGTRSIPILHKAAHKAGISSGVPRKKQTAYSLGLTGKLIAPLKQTINFWFILNYFRSFLAFISWSFSSLFCTIDTPDLSQLTTSDYAKGMPGLELHEPQPKSKLATNIVRRS